MSGRWRKMVEANLNAQYATRNAVAKREKLVFGFVYCFIKIDNHLASFVWEFEVCERCLFERSESRCVTCQENLRPTATNKGMYIICTIVPCIWLAKTIPWKRNELAKKEEELQAYNTNSLFVFDKKKKKEKKNSKWIKKRKGRPEWKRTPSSPFKNFFCGGRLMHLWRWAKEEENKK